MHAVEPSLSPDGRSVALGAQGKLKRIEPGSWHRRGDRGCPSASRRKLGRGRNHPVQGTYKFPYVSPDGRRIAVTVQTDVGSREAVIVDIASGAWARLGSEGDLTAGGWMPDGKHLLLFGSRSRGTESASWVRRRKRAASDASSRRGRDPRRRSRWERRSLQQAGRTRTARHLASRAPRTARRPAVARDAQCRGQPELFPRLSLGCLLRTS